MYDFLELAGDEQQTNTLTSINSGSPSRAVLKHCYRVSKVSSIALAISNIEKGKRRRRHSFRKPESTSMFEGPVRTGDYITQ